ncbi:response regulator [Sphingomonas lenta]|uniref:Response regulator n=1 Tax=Sphingomonas lenta TaxID=1141887 RepID=A0A2A2SF86_9SPHN|nr:response regulator [Sphingomonas lenta]PAX07898.1 response regulator [Sphingomonas lenta]
MCHVLIIEDEPLIALDIEMILAEQGATSFDVATTEDDAVARALDHRPDLITSDVKLAAGRGPDAVERIEEALGPVPVMFVTGSPDECRPCDPPKLVLPKPVTTAALTRAFRKLRRG